MSKEFTEEDIINIEDLEEEGFYWIADTSGDDPEWFIAWVSGEPGRDPGSDSDDDGDSDDDEDSEDEDEDDEYFQGSWEYSTTPDDYSQDLDDSYIFIGPVDPPNVQIPMAAPRAKLELERLGFEPVRVELPSLTPTTPTAPAAPVLIPLLKVIKK